MYLWPHLREEISPVYNLCTVQRAYLTHTSASVHQVLAEMEDEYDEAKSETHASPDSEATSAMKPSPSALMLAAGLASAQNTLRDRGVSEAGDEQRHAPSTELQPGWGPADTAVTRDSEISSFTRTLPAVRLQMSHCAKAGVYESCT